MDDMKEVLGNILLEEAEKLGLVVINKHDLNKQKLFQALKRLTFILEKLDDYSKLSRRHEHVLDRLFAEIDDAWDAFEGHIKE